jgi:hypothetical protein
MAITRSIIRSNPYMSNPFPKARFLIVCIVCVCYSHICGAQSITSEASPENQLNRRKWFIVLPLRFTHLQNTNTMLSGVKGGRMINDRLNMKSFKAAAGLPGFDEQPRLFINGVGAEFDFNIFRQNNLSAWAQLFTGWGFMNYDLAAHAYKSRQANYITAEPAFSVEYKLNTSTALGLGIGYRMIVGDNYIRYNSDISNGRIPVNKGFPNGTNVLLTLKGYL